ncbi:hypothetical protein FO519_003207 [Halicephalobus sp. NKZ332]|nr:hypothetical protein FO519_003207 [Halicephalobus sp. NKZ332]
MEKLSLFLISLLIFGINGQEGANQEFSPYVFKSVKIPYKGRNYAGDFFNQDVAYVQSPFLAQGKPGKLVPGIKLPTIRPYVVRWSNLDDVRVNNENVWNFEKRIDSKVWWP